MGAAVEDQHPVGDVCPNGEHERFEKAVRGNCRAGVIMASMLPALPRSTGFGPVSGPVPCQNSHTGSELVFSVLVTLLSEYSLIKPWTTCLRLIRAVTSAASPPTPPASGRYSLARNLALDPWRPGRGLPAPSCVTADQTSPAPSTPSSRRRHHDRAHRRAGAADERDLRAPDRHPAP